MYLYHYNDYDPRELLEEYAAMQRADNNTTTIYDVDGTTKLGTARRETNDFGKLVYRGYWTGSSTPIKEKRWNRDFSSVEEVTRYMRAWKGTRGV
jgi:hypothetical protein